MPLIRKDTAKPAQATGEARDPFAMLREGGPDARWAAARVLSSTPEGVAALAAALLDERDARVREAIFTALAGAGTHESCLAVLPSLRSDDASLRTGALDALRAMPEAAATVMPHLLSDHDADVRLLSCEIARSLPVTQGQALLCGLLDTETEPNVCAAAVEVLAELGDPGAEPALGRCAERFAHEPFLAFAIKIARQRLDGGTGGVGD